ncbi:MAG: excinuclease ABC subunit UvrA [Bacteroidetes bacterium]|nr:excinuclease ABC subunit UvrA [Bacteroidota bacterium]
MDSSNVIRIVNASENNLNSVTLDIPKNKLVVVTGVSGSGKSSLIFDVLYREAEFRYFGSFSAYARQFLGKMKRPEVERIDGLSPAVAVDQGSVINNPRSTVGTISGIHDQLRLLFARTGDVSDIRYPISDIGFPLTRSLFSFNSPEGACPKCKGLGVEDRLDPELLIGDTTKSIRQRAMTITTPNGYIMYSQVTLDVLDQVCRAEGFTIDIPWKDLTPENKQVVFYGSDKIEIPFGKHPLESRMKWSGITAKPREMGVYKGIIPVMEEILKRDRNKNILRFVRTSPCQTCGGKRLNPRALSVKVGGKDISEFSALPVTEMSDLLLATEFPAINKDVSKAIVQSIVSLSVEMNKLGLGHLSASRESGSLSAGESRRLKLATQLGSCLSGLIYVFDEPSIGLNGTETLALIGVLKQLRDQGNTVIVVEHEDEFIRHADHLIDIGPGPGVFGGNVLLNIAVSDLKDLAEDVISRSKTLSYFFGRERVESQAIVNQDKGVLKISGACHHNLKHVDIDFLLQALNVVTGVSGAGKASLVHQTLGSFIRVKLDLSNEEPGKHGSITGWEGIKRLIEIDQSPIGRTPRSNPATYTGLFDHIRDLFASLPEAVARGYGKSRFSFNTQGGRCEECQGAGYKQTGMHFMGNVETLCETCNGRRFDNETLEIQWNGKNIYEILEMPVSEALKYFEGEKKILCYLQTLDELGLGYLTLGQRSSTLSGGEAQRIKLASELLKYTGSGMRNEGSRILHPASIYILDEPTTGLHNDDVKKLLACLNGLIVQGHTIICIEHHEAVLRSAGRIIELGPGSGREGGELVFAGDPGEYFREEDDIRCQMSDIRYPTSEIRNLTLSNVTTHNLKGINVTIPHGRLTVVTGVSGSGKSSLAFDTIHAEARNRFLGNFSAYARSQIGMKDKPDFDEIKGLRPTFAVEQSGVQSNPRSTVGTYTGIYDLYRLLFSRAGLQTTSGLDDRPEPSALNQTNSKQRLSDTISRPLSTVFSFNSIQGACLNCDGLGMLTLCDKDKLITNPELPILHGAMDGSKTGQFYGDPYGQYIATLKAVGEMHDIDFGRPWNELSSVEKELALNGCGEEIYNVSWEFLRKKRSGIHHFKGKWQGLLSLVNEEYARKHADHRGESMMNIMSRMVCPSCLGRRLNEEALSWLFCGKNIAEISGLSISDTISFFENVRNPHPVPGLKLGEEFSAHIPGPMGGFDPAVTLPLVLEILRRLNTLDKLGLSYLSVSRRVGSLSHGEARRLQLATQTGSGLSGMIYILDEPTAGLHPRDTARLIGHIRTLISERNTVIAVEHEREVILGADHIIDMGPGAGAMGGEIVAEGNVEDIINSKHSITGKYLGDAKNPTRSGIRVMSSGLSIKNAFIHNLKNFDLEIPSGGLICITGVSGSGKSSLVFDLMYASWLESRAIGCQGIAGFERFSKVVSVEQKEEFNSALAVVATYSGAFDLIRNLFASLVEAKKGGFSKNHFSFLNKQSQCPNCEGMGQSRISMDFMPDIYQECEVCLGKRFRPEILEIGYCGKDISEILDLSISEAGIFFAGHKQLQSILKNLDEAGLGYLKLGQPLNTLSGGEAQRLNLCRELMASRIPLSRYPASRLPAPRSQLPAPSSPLPAPASLYLFDEPSTGLHFFDIENLLKLFHRLADEGNTLIIIEHDQQIISEADHVIELGPEGGERGGYLVKAVNRVPGD